MSNTLTKSIYPNLEKRFTEKTLQRIFEPQEHEKALINTHSRSKSRMVHIQFATLLKSTEYLHYVPKPIAIPLYIYRFVAKSMFPGELIRKADIDSYAKSGSARRHIHFIKAHFGYKYNDGATRALAMTIAQEAAKTMARTIDILNATIEGLIRAHYELPSITTLEKISRTAKVESNAVLYQSVVNQLSVAQQQKLDHILSSSESPKDMSLWELLKMTPDLPTKNTLAEYLRRFDLIRDIASSQPSFSDIPSEKKLQLFNEANALHISDMRDISPEKRYALAAMLVSRRWSDALDFLAIIVIKVMQSIENKARKTYMDAYVSDKTKTNTLITVLRDLIYDLENARNSGEQDHFVEFFLKEKGRLLVEACDQHLAKSQDNYKPFMLKGFTNKRKMMFSLLQRLPLGSDRHAKSLVDFGNTLMKLYETNKDKQLSLHKTNLDLAWLLPSWKPFVLTNTSVDSSNDQVSIQRHYLELAWFSQLKEQLKSYHCFLEGASKFGNPEDFLISWEEFEALMPKLLETTDLPTDAKTFISQIKSELKQTANAVDADFQHVEGVYFENNELVIQKAAALYKSKTIEGLPDTYGPKRKFESQKNITLT